MTSATTLLITSCIILHGLAFNFDPMQVIYTTAPLLKRENLQTFTGSLGGSAPAITDTGDSQRPYRVDEDTFPDYASAAQRSCDDQFNSCQELANTDQSVSFSLQDCQDQQSKCDSAQSSATATSFSIASTSTSTSSSSSTTSTSSTSSSSTSATNTGTIAKTTMPYDSSFDLVCDL